VVVALLAGILLLHFSSCPITAHTHTNEEYSLYRRYRKAKLLMKREKTNAFSKPI